MESVAEVAAEGESQTNSQRSSESLTGGDREEQEVRNDELGDIQERDELLGEERTQDDADPAATIEKNERRDNYPHSDNKTIEHSELGSLSQMNSTQKS